MTHKRTRDTESAPTGHSLPPRARVRVEDLGTTCAVDVLGPRGHLAITEILDDLEDLRPTGERPVVDALVLVNGHNEFEQLAGDLTFLGCTADFSAAAPRPPASIHPLPPITSPLPSVVADGTLTLLCVRLWFWHTRQIGEPGIRLDLAVNARSKSRSKHNTRLAAVIGMPASRHHAHGRLAVPPLHVIVTLVVVNVLVVVIGEILVVVVLVIFFFVVVVVEFEIVVVIFGACPLRLTA